MTKDEAFGYMALAGVSIGIDKETLIRLAEEMAFMMHLKSSSEAKAAAKQLR